MKSKQAGASQFGESYSKCYDAVYRHKDYQKECDVLENIFRRYCVSAKTILDLGCGTGNHAIPFGLRGYQVLGVDRSLAMILQAKRKSNDLPVEFLHLDIQSLNLSQKFDVILMMFAVLGYQVEDSQLTTSLQVVQQHLNPGGVFLFDCWYGPAVRDQKPERRTQEIFLEEAKVTRVSLGTLRPQTDLCDVEIRTEIEERGGRREFKESHTMRFFYRAQLEKLFLGVGLRLCQLTGFPNTEQEADKSTWNVLGVATEGLRL